MFEIKFDKTNNKLIAYDNYAKRVIEKIISNDLRRDGNGGIKM